MFVCVTANDGALAVIDRRRVELIDPGLPSQPYHHETLALNAAEAEELVKEVRESAVQCAERALSRLQSGLEAPREIVSIALREAPLPKLPQTVAEAHASRPVMFSADAMLYHDALCRAAALLGIDVALHNRGEELTRASEVLGVKVQSLERFFHDVRGSLGPPRRKEHQAAAAGAIAVLGKYATLKLPDAA